MATKPRNQPLGDGRHILEMNLGTVKGRRVFVSVGPPQATEEEAQNAPGLEDGDDFRKRQEVMWRFLQQQSTEITQEQAIKWASDEPKDLVYDPYRPQWSWLAGYDTRKLRALVAAAHTKDENRRNREAQEAERSRSHPAAGSRKGRSRSQDLKRPSREDDADLQYGTDVTPNRQPIPHMAKRSRSENGHRGNEHGYFAEGTHTPPSSSQVKRKSRSQFYGRRLPAGSPQQHQAYDKGPEGAPGSGRLDPACGLPATLPGGQSICELTHARLAEGPNFTSPLQAPAPFPNLQSVAASWRASAAPLASPAGIGTYTELGLRQQGLQHVLGQPQLPALSASSVTGMGLMTATAVQGQPFSQQPAPMPLSLPLTSVPLGLPGSMLGSAGQLGVLQTNQAQQQPQDYGLHSPGLLTVQGQPAVLPFQVLNTDMQPCSPLQLLAPMGLQQVQSANAAVATAPQHMLLVVLPSPVQGGLLLAPAGGGHLVAQATTGEPEGMAALLPAQAAAPMQLLGNAPQLLQGTSGTILHGSLPTPTSMPGAVQQL